MTVAEQIYQAGFDPFSVPLPLKLSEHADKHFILAAESSSIEGPWVSLPYQVGPLNWIGNDDISTITFRKSARVGYTKMICASIVYFAEHKKRNITVYQPTDGDAKTFAEDEIDPIILAVPVLRAICKSDPEKKSSNFTIERKKFRGSTLDILGGKSPRNYRRYTKDVIIYDELSGFDSDIGGEGSPTSLGDTRLQTSSFPKSIRGSTPKIKNSCLVSSSLAEADIVLVRWLPCPHCQETQFLEWKNFDHETSKYICRHCGSLIGYESYSAMDKAGQWRTRDGRFYYDDELDQFFDGETDEAIADPDHVGLEIWSAYSYFLTWGKLISEFKNAYRDYKNTGDFTKLKSFINTRLGEVWEERGERVEGTIFEGDRLEDTPEKLSSDILFLTMGVDVQGGKKARLEYEIVGHGIGEESWSIDFGVISGDPDSEHVWDNLDEIRKTKHVREDGVALRVSCCLVDSGYNPDSVYKYTTPRQRHRVYATKGHSIAGKPIENGFSLQGTRKKTRLYMVGTDTAKGVLYYRLNNISTPGPGFCHFPDHYDEEYFKQLTAEEKRKKRDKRTGRISYEWVKTRERNEALDCRILNIVAVKILNPNFNAIKRRLLKTAERIARRDSVDLDEKVKKITTELGNKIKRRPTKRPTKRGGFSGGFKK